MSIEGSRHRWLRRCLCVGRCRAKSIEVRTKPRGSFPDRLVLLSEKVVGDDLPGCTYVGMVLDNLGATFWKKQGGTAKRYTKGMAGPDFSAMHEVISKEAKSCTSKVFLFSSSAEHGSLLRYRGLGESCRSALPDIDKLVLASGSSRSQQARQTQP